MLSLVNDENVASKSLPPQAHPWEGACSRLPWSKHHNAADLRDSDHNGYAPP
jgi:hypothetical protein